MISITHFAANNIVVPHLWISKGHMNWCILNRRLQLMYIPQKIGNFILKLFSCCSLSFVSPSEHIVTRSTHRGFPQGSCLSPILFNSYMTSISSDLELNVFHSLFYADNMVDFSNNTHRGLI